MRALALSLAAVAALSACGGSSEEPRTTPPVSSSPVAVAATPTPTGIDAPTPEGASEFAKHFYAQVTEGFRRADPSLVSALSLSSCKTCRLYIDSIAEVRDKKQRFQGEGFKVNFAVAPADSSANARVDVGLDFLGATIFAKDGSVVEETPPMLGVEEQMALARQGNAWRVVTLKRVVKR